MIMPWMIIKENRILVDIIQQPPQVCKHPKVKKRRNSHILSVCPAFRRLPLTQANLPCKDSRHTQKISAAEALASTAQTAPSDEGAVSEADWGRENVEVLTAYQHIGNFYVFSPSVACGASSLIRGSLGRCKRRRVYRHSHWVARGQPSLFWIKTCCPVWAARIVGYIG